MLPGTSQRVVKVREPDVAVPDFAEQLQGRSPEEAAIFAVKRAPLLYHRKFTALELDLMRHRALQGELDAAALSATVPGNLITWVPGRRSKGVSGPPLWASPPPKRVGFQPCNLGHRSVRNARRRGAHDGPARHGEGVTQGRYPLAARDPGWVRSAQLPPGWRGANVRAADPGRNTPWRVAPDRWPGAGAARGQSAQCPCGGGGHGHGKRVQGQRTQPDLKRSSGTL
ncbi:hypothetical protein SAMN00790413_05065 [Deinococcus hopiensis KR-140]|uniref:Uncharacterized protein n=1 Tax=Deinococcus hopiensis KR-140 TaxID=695939 RepID=A0A1W1UT05_9DEIO|nr:hypothetical protein SAMN00790413_05065 [Deinococcus hopiensis KR-140]